MSQGSLALVRKVDKSNEEEVDKSCYSLENRWQWQQTTNEMLLSTQKIRRNEYQAPLKMPIDYILVFLGRRSRAYEKAFVSVFCAAYKWAS